MPFAAFLLLGIVLNACATPSQKLLQQADGFGMTRHVLTANSFELESFYKVGIKANGILHVYLEGDGLPWLTEDRVSADPTPRNPLMLRLMALDPSSSLYLGRPCYNGHAEDEGCSPLLWTHRRYAPEVVAAMTDALAGFMRNYRYSGLVLIGHSGGGALALLLAQRFPATLAVLTLAGNADIDVWADLHRYSRLQGSLNPANAPGGEYPEFHYLGENDETIPPQVFQPVLRKRKNARIIIMPGFDHVCCWEKRWSVILHNPP